MESRVTRVTGFPPANFPLAVPFRSGLRVRHGTDRWTDNGHHCIMSPPYGDGRINIRPTLRFFSRLACSETIGFQTSPNYTDPENFIQILSYTFSYHVRKGTHMNVLCHVACGTGHMQQSAETFQDLICQISGLFSDFLASGWKFRIFHVLKKMEAPIFSIFCTRGNPE